MIRLLRWRMLAPLVLGVVAFLVASVRTQQPDAEEHRRMIELIAELKRAEAVIGREVLRQRNGLVQHNDQLPRLTRRMMRLASQIESRICPLSGSGECLQSYTENLRLRVDALERFSSANAVMHHSTKAVPVLVDIVSARAPEARERVRELALRTAYPKTRFRADAAVSCEQVWGELRELARDDPRLQHKLGSLEKHLDHISTSRIRVDDLTEAALTSEGESHLRELRQLTDAAFRQQSLEASANQRVLALSAAFLLIALGGLTFVNRRAAMRLERERQASCVALAASKAKDEFLANMSHELRTPINGIIGMTELLQQSRVDREQAQHLRIVEGSSRALLALVNDILDSSKIEAGQMTIEEIPFDLPHLMEEILAPFRLAAEQEGVALRCHVASEARGWFLGDPLRIRQILTNLVGNALKFTSEGFVEVRVSLDDRRDAEPRVLIEVEDSGIGIPAESLGRIFQKFEQADGSTTRRFGGTGLGLSITRQLAELMSGEIAVRSEVGRGSIFTVALPLATAVAPGLEAASSEERSLEGVRVLLVEDNEVNALIARKALERAGAEVSLAGDGAQALRFLASAEAVDVVLMDIQMPVMDGLEATRRLRSMPGVDAIPVIAMTANHFESDRARCLEAGMDGFVSKPFLPGELEAAIRQRVAAVAR